MDLATFWFILVAVLWVGYLALEGFDFGVGMLMPIVGKTPKGKRVLLNTIGPVWDGNEVWLLTAVVRLSLPSQSGTQPCSRASTCHCS